MASVGATDIDGIDIQSSGSSLDDVLSTDVENIQEVSSSENSLDDEIVQDLSSSDGSLDDEIVQDKVASSNENNVLNASFNDLQSIIDSAHDDDVIELSKDYSIADGGKTITISRNLTIDGKGHTLNGNDGKTIFSITEDSKKIILKNITFCHGKTSGKGGAISNSHSSSSLEIYDCKFNDNYADDLGGAIYSKGYVYLMGCSFDNNYADNYGGAVYIDNEVKIRDTSFDGNRAIIEGGAVYSSGKTHILNSQFRDNKAFGSTLKKCNGGALRTLGECYIELGYFRSNYASSIGGAIYATEVLTLNDSHLLMNNAGSLASAIYTEAEITAVDSKFDHNDDSGLYLIYAKNAKCNIDSCVFDSNKVCPLVVEDDLRITGKTMFKNNYNDGAGGGAIYAVKNLYINWNSDEDALCEFYSNTGSEGCLGGAIHCEGNLYGRAMKFSQNHIPSSTKIRGGAIYCEGETHINSSDFSDNWVVIPGSWIENVPCEGGAIWSKGKCYIDSCNFSNNKGGCRGGAICAYDDLKITGKNSFKNNTVFVANLAVGICADPDGGAIYCKGNAVIDNAVFTINEAIVDGGAIFCEKECTVSNSKFINNSVNDLDAFVPGVEASYGGAIRSNGFLTIKNCSFEDNYAYTKGGAVYADNGVKVSGGSFISNFAPVDGGAIYSKGKTTLSDATFYRNTASHVKYVILEDSYGGAVRSKGLVTVENCSFDENFADQYGSAIYAYADLNIKDSSFTNHVTSKSGGAIYCEGDAVIDNSVFSNNNVDELDGGAIFCEGYTTISNSVFSNNSVNSYSERASYGGAVRSKKSITISNSTFEDNFANNHGGAIFSDGYTTMSDCSFYNNKANVDGGAVYSEGPTTIYNSIFKGNRATGKTLAKSFGGAVRSNGEVSVKYSLFESNYATNRGGAIHSVVDIRVENSNFTENVIDNEDGGAIYSDDNVTITHSIFKGNSALGKVDKYRSFGGAVCSYGVVDVKYSSFDDNFAFNRGGAIFAFKELKMRYNNFTNNSAKDYGGAIFTRTVYQRITNSNFIDNKVTSGDGGAIYINNSCSPSFSTCYFEWNEANNLGGAIYVDSKDAPLGIAYCTFLSNKAKEGGAVYTQKISGPVVYSTFLKNDAGSGDGGAIYINKSCDPDFNSCRFEQNACNGRGGAIYLDSSSAKLSLFYCTFVDNSAGNRGQTVFNCGKYKHIKMCWLGKNDPSKKDQFKEWHAWPAADTDFTDFTPSKISIKINDSKFYIGNTYKLTVYFTSTDEDVLHSEGRFYGDGDYYNVEADVMNDMTADVVFNEENPTVHFKLDHQELTLKPNVKAKSLSMVVIDSCKDVEYPNALNVDYQIVNMTKAGYSIVNSQGQIVSQGNIIDSRSTITVENLNVGSYSISIYNAENESTSPSNASASFKVYKDLGTANVTADNVTYGDYTTITLKADADGLYNVSINGTVLEMEVINGIATKQVKLNAGNYQTHTSAGDGILIDCNEASFNVSKASPNFNITVSKADFDFGEDVLVSYELPADATSLSLVGAFAFYINNIWFDNFEMGDEVRFTGLDIGSYFIQAYYSGDNNYLADKANVTFNVKQLKNHVIVSATNVTYGEESLIRISADIDGIYQIDVNGTLYNVTVENGVGEKSVRLNAGTYYANASFDNDNYNTTAKNGTFEVYKADIDLVVVVFDEFYPDDIECIVYASRDGDYNLTIGDDSTIVAVVGNLAYFEHGTLEIGTYKATVSFKGDGNYNPVSNTTIFSVYPGEGLFELEVNPSEICYGETATVSHILSDGATGTIRYYLNNGTFLGEFGVDQNLTLPVLDVGNYIIIGNYSGDYHLIPSSDSTFIKVNQALNNAKVTVSNVTYGEDAIIEVSADVDGIYHVEINGTIYNVTVNNGLGNISIPLNAGTYYANVTFDNRNYNTRSKNTVFEVYKADINLIVTVAETVYYEDILGIVYSDVDGEYNLTVGDFSTLINVKDGFAEYNAGLFDAGNYTIVVTYPGDVNHKANSSSVNVTVGKYVPKLQVSVQDIDYGDAALIAIICDLQGSVNVTVNGITQTLELGGKVTRLLFASSSVVKSQTRGFLTLHNLDAGVYPVTVVYNGDDNIESVEADEEFEVHALNTTMDIEAKDITVGEDEKITVKLPSNATGNVTVTVDGKNYTAELKNGKATISIPNLSAGNKNAKVYYSGCNNYNPSESEVSFKVSKVKANMTAESDDPIKKGEKLHIVVRLPKDATGKVSITVGGKTYTKAVKDGKAVFDISGLDPGKYNLKAQYSGDDKYYEDQIELSITVKDNGKGHENNTENNTDNNTDDNGDNNTDNNPDHNAHNQKNRHSQGIDLSSKVTGNPILALILSLMTIGFADIRRFKK